MDADYALTPVPKVRMTRSDRWKKRPPVLRYFKFKDDVRAAGVELPVRHHVTFTLPMPKSWSKKKRVEMIGKPHQSKPDIDNLAKALLDAVYDDDAHIWDGRYTKVWGDSGNINIKELQ